MNEQVVISSSTALSIKPLVESALNNEKKILQHGIQRTNKRLAEFEAQFKMTSADFEKKVKSGEIEETLTTIDWAMEIKALRLLEEQYEALRNARID